MGVEEVPCGLGLRTGDRSDTVDSFGTAEICPVGHGLLGGTRRSELRTSVFFLLEGSTSDWHTLRLALLAKGGGAGLCVCGCIFISKGSEL